MQRRIVLAAAAAVAAGAITGGISRPAAAGAAMAPSRARLTAGRAAHQAALLPDGTLLMIGGFTTESTTLATSDRFDPVADQVRPGPDLAVARHSHTVTPLRDGSFLIVGGYDRSPLASVELLDPVAGRSEVIGELASPRAGHVAIGLDDGRVLIAGGVGPDWTFLASAEVFDPATATFALVAPMALARESHTGTLLADGRVLIAGGHQGRRATFTVHQSAEVYDPATGVFAPVGALTARRHKHDAVRLADGRVLLVGGADERDQAGAYATTELFRPDTSDFIVGPALRDPRYKLQGTTVVMPGGGILVTAGATTVESLAPAATSFARLAGRYGSPRLFATATSLLGGEVIVAGGYGAGVTADNRLWRLRPA